MQRGRAFLRQHIDLGAEGQQQPHTVGLGPGTGLVQGGPAPDPGVQLSSLLDQVAGAVGVASGSSDGEGCRMLGFGGQHPEPWGEQAALRGVGMRLAGRAGCHVRLTLPCPLYAWLSTNPVLVCTCGEALAQAPS